MFLPDCLLSLGLADLGLLVPFGQDLSQGGTSDGPLELDGTAGTLLAHLFLLGHGIVASRVNPHEQ